MSESATEKNDKPEKQPVVVASDFSAALEQPDTFQLCPLGLQLYSEKAVAPFSVMSVDIEVPDNAGHLKTIACTGAVVRCQPEKDSDRFRVWIQFLDLPEDTRENLKCTARAGNFLCSYCLNY